MLLPRLVSLTLVQALPLLFLWGYVSIKAQIHANRIPDIPLLAHLGGGILFYFLYFLVAVWLVDALANLNLRTAFKSRYWEAAGLLTTSSIIAGVMNTPSLCVAGACLIPAAVAYYVYPPGKATSSASLIFTAGWGLLAAWLAGALLYAFIQAEITTPGLLVAGVVILFIPCLRIYCLLTAWRLSRSAQGLGHE